MHFEALKTFRLRMRHCFCKMRWCVRHPEVVSTAILYCTGEASRRAGPWTRRTSRCPQCEPRTSWPRRRTRRGENAPRSAARVRVGKEPRVVREVSWADPKALFSSVNIFTGNKCKTAVFSVSASRHTSASASGLALGIGFDIKSAFRLGMRHVF